MVQKNVSGKLELTRRKKEMYKKKVTSLDPFTIVVLAEAQQSKLLFVFDVVVCAFFLWNGTHIYFCYKIALKPRTPGYMWACKMTVVFRPLKLSVPITSIGEHLVNLVYGCGCR